jgi:hypothetical protein
MAFGCGVHIISRKDKYVMVLNKDEFIIPSSYSDTARKELDAKLWKSDDVVTIKEKIKQDRQSWSLLKKRDKIHLLYTYISQLKKSQEEKIKLCHIITMMLLLKIFKNSNLIYNNNTVLFVDFLKKKDIYSNIIKNEINVL